MTAKPAFIDFSSTPPVPALSGSKGEHLSNYRRVYAKSEKASGRHDGGNTLESYLDTYQSLGAAAVVVKAKDTQHTFGQKIRNEDVAEFCRTHSRPGGPRYVGFAGVDPHNGYRAVKELEHAVQELGLRGLNLQCFELKLAIDDRRMYPLYVKCIELGIPVNVHCGINFSTSTTLEYGLPIQLDRVLVDLPELQVCASPPGWPYIFELLGIAWRHKSLRIGIVAVRPKVLGIEHSGYEPLVQYGRTTLQDQIIWGTSFPMQPVARALDETIALGLPEEVQRKWLHDNAAAFLGL